MKGFLNLLAKARLIELSDEERALAEAGSPAATGGTPTPATAEDFAGWQSGAQPWGFLARVRLEVGLCSWLLFGNRYSLSSALDALNVYIAVQHCYILNPND